MRVDVQGLCCLRGGRARGTTTGDTCPAVPFPLFQHGRHLSLETGGLRAGWMGRRPFARASRFQKLHPVAAVGAGAMTRQPLLLRGRAAHVHTSRPMTMCRLARDETRFRLPVVSGTAYLTVLGRCSWTCKTRKARASSVQWVEEGLM